jgi:membrane protease YdiL (CAAX protease family)
VLFPLVLRCVPAVGPQTAALYAAFGRATPLKLAMMLLVIVGEEGVWRGAVQQRLAGYLGRWPAVAVTAVLYAIAHLPVGSPLLAVVALCCGLYWSHLAAWTGSLLCPLLTHAIWDVAVLVVWPLLRI